jgi:transposase InsO family protein
LSPVSVDSPNTLIGIDFIGPFPAARLSKSDVKRILWPQLYRQDSLPSIKDTQPGEYQYILMVIDYFSRFIWAFPCTTDNSEEVCRSLGWLWSIIGTPVAVYSDEGTHFSSTQIQSFFAQKGVLWIPAPVAAKKATGIVEKANDVFQRVLKKSKKSRQKWVFEVQSAAFETNHREIRHLGYSPFEIQYSYQPLSAVDFKFRSFNQVQS